MNSESLQCHHHSDRYAGLWLFGICVIVAFPLVMTTLAPYDDQGYVMMTLQTFHAGAPLYTETHTQYGPAYYLLTDSLHYAFGLPLTQDGVRLKTVLFWCLSTLIVFGVLRRFQVPVVVSVASACLFHLHMDKLALEPGHPQEWTLLLSLLCMWFVSGDSRFQWYFAAIVVGFIGMIKLNCGAVMALPLLTQAIINTRTGISENRPKVRFWLQVILAGGMTSASIVLALWSLGTHPKEQLWGVLLQHQRFTREFFHPIPWCLESMVFAVVSMGIFVWVRGLPHSQQYRKQNIKLCVVAMGFLGALFGLLADIGHPLQHGLEVRGAAAWLVLAGPALTPWLFIEARGGSKRWFLTLSTCLAPLVAVPTPGTQLSLGTCYSWILFGVLFSDCRESVPNLLTKVENGSSGFRRRVLIPLLGFCFVWVALPGWHRWWLYDATNLPGSSLLRLEPQLAENERRIAQSIRETECKSLVFDGHNHNRFFFWTDTSPLTAANPTFWPRMLTSKEQSRFLLALNSQDRLCVVLPPEADALSSDSTRFLREELLNGWVETSRIGDWRIGVRYSHAHPSRN